jgi:hypothetical protein
MVLWLREALPRDMVMVHVVIARAGVASSRSNLIFQIEFAWLGTREDAARHLQTLITPLTFDYQRWMKKMPPMKIFETKKTAC